MTPTWLLASTAGSISSPRRTAQSRRSPPWLARTVRTRPRPHPHRRRRPQRQRGPRRRLSPRRRRPRPRFPRRRFPRRGLAGGPPPPQPRSRNAGSQIRVTGSELANVPAPPDAVLLVFTNSSTATCSLTGYPGVAALAAAGQQVAQATRTLAGRDGGCGCSKPPTVTLTPGKQASTIVEYDHYIKCQQPTALLVTPPNTTHSVKVPCVPDGQCGYVVHPVIPGDHGVIAKQGRARSAPLHPITSAQAAMRRAAG